MSALVKKVSVEGTEYAVGTESTAIPDRHFAHLTNPAIWDTPPVSFPDRAPTDLAGLIGDATEAGDSLEELEALIRSKAELIAGILTAGQGVERAQGLAGPNPGLDPNDYPSGDYALLAITEDDSSGSEYPIAMAEVYSDSAGAWGGMLVKRDDVYLGAGNAPLQSFAKNADLAPMDWSGMVVDAHSGGVFIYAFGDKCAQIGGLNFNTFFGDVIIESAGRGILLTSPDGATTKRLRIDNAGAVFLDTL